MKGRIGALFLLVGLLAPLRGCPVQQEGTVLATSCDVRFTAIGSYMDEVGNLVIEKDEIDSFACKQTFVQPEE